MKAILKFNLPEEQYEFDRAIKAGDYLLSLSEIFQALRAFNKYGGHQNKLTSDLLGDTFETCIADYLIDNQKLGLDNEQCKAIAGLVKTYCVDTQDVVCLFDLRDYLYSLIDDKVKEDL